MVLVTVLGSCVSACLRDPRTGIGGMNHFMLPDDGGDAGNPLSTSARYGVYAMELLINEILKAGATAAPGGEGVRRRQCPAGLIMRRSADATRSSR